MSYGDVGGRYEKYSRNIYEVDYNCSLLWFGTVST